MNTMAHIAAMVAILWLSISYLINTLGETELGVALLVLFFMFVPLTLRAIMADIGDFQSLRGRDR
jgi:uncharacterized integral membrane protein